MAGRGPAPKERESRVGRAAPVRGEYQQAEAKAWRGEVPAAPEGLTDAAAEAWRVWFGSWFAAYWTPSDIPAIRQMVRLYDQVEQGEFQRASELRLMMDTYGVTPKGQQDRRWKPPAPAPAEAEQPKGGKRYGHLRSA